MRRGRCDAADVRHVHRTARATPSRTSEIQPTPPTLGAKNSVLQGKTNYQGDLPVIDFAVLDVTARFSHL
jgi:hypothetical protein